MTEGLIWHSTPRATVGLLVSRGVVVDAPPYARRWALNRPAAELLNDPRAQTAWIPERNTMTDTMPEQVGPDTEAEGWSDEGPSVTYPQFPENPHNHRFTISMNGQGPMVVVRGNTAEEVNAGFQELEAAATGAVMGNAWAAIKAAAMLANGVGPVSPVGPPQGAPAPVQPVPLPQSPQAQYPVGPPALPQGPAPAAWQNAGAPAVQNNAPEFQQNGWYRLNVPFPKKGAFDAIVAQYQMRKGRPTEGGLVSFNKADKSWYVAPTHAGAFGDFSPVPA